MFHGYSLVCNQRINYVFRLRGDLRVHIDGHSRGKFEGWLAIADLVNFVGIDNRSEPSNRLVNPDKLLLFYPHDIHCQKLDPRSFGRAMNGIPCR